VNHHIFETNSKVVSLEKALNGISSIHSVDESCGWYC
jgi:hypothetical protein